MPIIPLAVSLAQMFGPGLVKWIAGDDAGTVAQKVVDVVQGVTGNTADPLAAAQALPPDKRIELTIALAKIEADREAAARQADLDTLRAELADTQNARARDVAIRQTGVPNTRANVLVAGSYVTLVAVVGAITASALKNWSLTGEVIALYSVLITGCIAILKDCSQFEFGSSRSSKDKDAVLAKIIQNGHG